MSGLHGLATRALRALDPEDAHGWAIRGLKLGLGPVGSGLVAMKRAPSSMSRMPLAMRSKL